MRNKYRGHVQKWRKTVQLGGYCQIMPINQCVLAGTIAGTLEPILTNVPLTHGDFGVNRPLLNQRDHRLPTILSSLFTQLARETGFRARNRAREKPLKNNKKIAIPPYLGLLPV